MVHGNHVVAAEQIYDVREYPAIQMKLNTNGSVKWEELTGNAYKNRSFIAITVNGEVHSAPGVTVGPIRGGNTQISGNYTIDEAQDLAAILAAGGAISELKLLNYAVYDPK